MLISVICPMYNESAGLDSFLQEMASHLGDLGEDYELVCVNDGSTDATLQMLRARQADYPRLRVINLSRNFGKEAALTAGLDSARGDIIIPVDADLQDPPELIGRMLEKHREGYDVVLARRIGRASDGYLKRTSAGHFYRLFGRISHIEIPQDVGDFRLMSRRVLEVLQSLPENQRFMKGIFAWAGFSTAYVDYVRPPRAVGKSRFSGWHLWNLALEGITSFSTVPLRIWTYIGAFVALSSFIYGSFMVIRTLVQGVDVPGYASLITIMLFLGGVQLIGIGIIGEYVGRTYMEVKRRPIYVIESET